MWHTDCNRGSGNGCPLPPERGESIAKGASRLPLVFEPAGFIAYSLSKPVPASDNHESRMGKMPTKWLSEPLSLGQRLLFMIWYILDSGHWDKGELDMHDIPETGFLRLPQVLSVIPLGKTSWWEGVRSGRFPKPVKLSARCTAWRAEDIRELIKTLSDRAPNALALAIAHYADC